MNCDYLGNKMIKNVGTKYYFEHSQPESNMYPKYRIKNFFNLMLADLMTRKGTINHE